MNAAGTLRSWWLRVLGSELEFIHPSWNKTLSFQQSITLQDYWDWKYSFECDVPIKVVSSKKSTKPEKWGFTLAHSAFFSMEGHFLPRICVNCNWQSHRNQEMQEYLKWNYWKTRKRPLRSPKAVHSYTACITIKPRQKSFFKYRERTYFYSLKLVQRA